MHVDTIGHTCTILYLANVRNLQLLCVHVCPDQLEVKFCSVGPHQSVDDGSGAGGSPRVFLPNRKLRELMQPFRCCYTVQQAMVWIWTIDTILVVVYT